MGFIWVLFFEIFFTLIVYTLKALIYIVKNSLLANFILAVFYFLSMPNIPHNIWWLDLILALLVGFIVVLALAKLKYIRVILLLALGFYWSRELFFPLAKGITNSLFGKFIGEEASARVGIVVCALYIIYHMYSGIVLSKKYFGKPINIFKPFVLLLAIIKRKLFRSPLDAEMEELISQQTEAFKTDFLFRHKKELATNESNADVIAENIFTENDGEERVSDKIIEHESSDDKTLDF